ncbi:MAG: hypothetical protein ACREBG_12985 [Pyrinomonadaceae bacterium]
MKLPQFSFIYVSATLAIYLAGTAGTSALSNARASAHVAQQASRSNLDHKIAAEFAPIFYQALGDKPRSDYITNFDFDGDWRGDNNWDHAEDKKFPLKAYVYYSVVETATHFFIHYAVFHPRDYKGGSRKGAILSDLIREGAKRGGKYDPTGLAEETALAHENDLEGCLVVVEKNGKDPEQGHTAYVETLHHNVFSRYAPGETSNEGSGPVILEGERPLLYIEPKGHGIEALDADRQKIGNKQYLIYKFAGRAEDPTKARDETVGYELTPIQTTLWARAQILKKAKETSTALNPTFGAVETYDSIVIELVQPAGRVVERKYDLGILGSAFLGKVGGQNMARPPWAWFDRNDREVPAGQWFFDPAKTIKRGFKLKDSFSTAYVRVPFWAMGK